MRDLDLLDLVLHDIGNQLTVINGFAEMLADGVDELPPDMLREFSQAILRNGEDMRSLLESVSDLRRLDVGDIEIRAEAVDLVPLVRASVERRRPDLGARRIEVALPDRLVTTADARRVSQIVARLLDNVARHTPRDAGVSVALGVVGDAVELSVTDDGPGIPAERVPELFELSQGSRASLYVSRAVARAHGGDLVLVDQPRGCRMVLRLPHLPA